MTNTAKNIFTQEFDQVRKTLPGADLPWLAAHRAGAMARFAEAGLPYRRLEAWRYTDLARLLAKKSFAPATPHVGAVMLPDVAQRPVAGLFAGHDRYVMLFVNGFFRPDLSRLDGLPAGVDIMPLTEALAAPWAKPLLTRPEESAGEAVVALNDALMRDGMAMRIGAGVVLDKPVHLTFVNLNGAPEAAHIRNLIRFEEGAQATLFETHIGLGSAFLADKVTDISLAPGARLTRLNVQDEAPDTLHIATDRLTLDMQARYEGLTVTFGGGVTRNQTEVALMGAGAHLGLYGAYAQRASEHCDSTCVVDHAVPECTSETFFRGVLDGAATGVFQGKVIVRPDAQHTQATQTSNALLLSRNAAMNAKPELEIYADDVQCSHGSTIGELDHAAMFYLMSRGIPETQARSLLVTAFLTEVLEKAGDPALSGELIGLAEIWLAETRLGKVRP